MSEKFYDRCSRINCKYNKLYHQTCTRRCEVLKDTDFGGEYGGEHCNFYKPKKADKRKSR